MLSTCQPIVGGSSSPSRPLLKYTRDAKIDQRDAPLQKAIVVLGKMDAFRLVPFYDAARDTS